MMPGDSSMASIVQRIARQALVTFRNPPVVGEEASKCFLENHSKLRSLMSEVRATDLKLVPRRADDSGAPPPQHPYHRGVPPVTYMHICETDQFSMGVFLLKSGASIPLHDHPGMHGVLKVMYGKVRISCFDRLERPGGSSALPRGEMGALRRCVLHSTGEYTEESGPCILSPDRDNLHQIDAVDGPTAFMDILAPPYDPDDGRDCHYYKVLPGDGVKDSEQKEKEVWLMEISQPAEFWCGGEPYPGPEVCL
ncbi:2-aminoethanethiol (cysteamine) dioxygenase b [Archocentrus centrarchus]|uniref:2-aminoethanethiol (cysteamine) dioxygenase b n=1 Tax=Archocentrus centrarchus TaxID=63155 RepID=UPI0011E9CC02|nr:2-aminoethanethiol dioxygenase-like [Archocentrus centrarchus]